MSGQPDAATADHRAIEPVNVRDAAAADVAFLVECNVAMALETEHKTLDRELLAFGIRGVFERPARGFYLIAERAGEALGCLMVTTEWSDWRNGTWWWLQSVYVMPEARRSGVFRALHHAVGARAAQARDVVGLRLYVERDNLAAQATYVGLGMAESGYRMFEKRR